MTHIMNVQVEMIAPEKWRYHEGFVRAKHIAGGSLALALWDDPVLDANAPCARIGPPGDVAARENARYIRFQKLVHQHSVVSRDTRLLGKLCVWANADSDHDQIAV